MNPPNKSATLRLYALGLLLLSFAYVLFNPITHTFEWYPKAITGLVATCIMAVIPLVLSFPAAKNKLWAHYAGAAFAFLLLIYGFSQAFTISRGLASATPDKAHFWYKGYVLGATAVVSLMALMPIMLYLRRERV